MNKRATATNPKVLALTEAYPTGADILRAGASRKLAKMILEAITEEFGLSSINDKPTFKVYNTDRYIEVDFQPLEEIGFQIDFRAEEKAIRVYNGIDGYTKNLTSKTETIVKTIVLDLKKLVRAKVKEEIKRAWVVCQLNVNLFHF
jgi:hypothetical protein